MGAAHTRRESALGNLYDHRPAAAMSAGSLFGIWTSRHCHQVGVYRTDLYRNQMHRRVLGGVARVVGGNPTVMP